MRRQVFVDAAQGVLVLRRANVVATVGGRGSDWRHGGRRGQNRRVTVDAGMRTGRRRGVQLGRAEGGGGRRSSRGVGRHRLSLSYVFPRTIGGGLDLERSAHGGL